MPETNNIQQKREIAYAVKSATVAVQDVDMTKRIVTGMFNTYNFFDSDYDVLLSGCSARSIKEQGPLSKSVQKIKHLMHHNWTMLPGKIQVLEEKKVNGIEGIYFETKMSTNTLGNDTLISYQDGVYDNHSIGFQYLQGEFVENGATGWKKAIDSLINPKDAKDAPFMYLWSEIKLYEGSTVAFGANALTPYLGVKSTNKEGLLLKVNERIELLEKQVRNGTQSDDTMQSFCMEILQLKQLINELFTHEPAPKDTFTGRPAKGSTDKKGIDFSKLTIR